MTSRRAFARRALCTVGAGAVGLTWIESIAAQTELRVDLTDPAYEPLTRIGGAVKVPVAGQKRPAMIVRVDEDTIIAYSSSCTHWGCEVELPDADGRVECHCHGAEFDLSGRYVDGPAQGDLERLPLQMITSTPVGDRTWGQVKQTYHLQEPVEADRETR